MDICLRANATYRTAGIINRFKSNSSEVLQL